MRNFVILFITVLLFYAFTNIVHAQNNNYFSKTFTVSFTNGEANKVVYVNIPNVHIWGNLKVTISGGYNHSHNIGELTKVFGIIYNVNGHFSQVTEIPVSYGSLSAQWAIGDMDKSGMRIPIYHLTSSGNQITIKVEGQLLYTGSVSTILSDMTLSNIESYTHTVNSQYAYYSNKVGINTPLPNYELDVNGTIHAKEVKIDNELWPDFVFEPDYALPSIDSVNNFIKKHGHLPSIPSEVQVKKEGVNLGEMNARLLQKVEELTLYVIELNKEIEMLKSSTNSNKNQTY